MDPIIHGGRKQGHTHTHAHTHAHMNARTHTKYRHLYCTCMPRVNNTMEQEGLVITHCRYIHTFAYCWDGRNALSWIASYIPLLQFIVKQFSRVGVWWRRFTVLREISGGVDSCAKKIMRFGIILCYNGNYYPTTMFRSSLLESVATLSWLYIILVCFSWNKLYRHVALKFNWLVSYFAIEHVQVVTTYNTISLIWDHRQNMCPH